VANQTTESRKWREIITPVNSIWTLPLKEIWRYRDLLVIWMQRDINSIYKQTILGPIWFILQPVLTTVTYFVIFTKLGNFSTIGLPPFLFYFSGIMLWSYFAESLSKTSTFFKDNSQIVSKVYFPKLIIPLSLVLTNLVKFGIQFVLFLLLYFYYLGTETTVHPNSFIFLFPLLVLMIAGLGLGLGMIISSLTTRYKDLAHLIGFGIQLLMFMSPVFFPVTTMANSYYKWLILANPMTGIIEAFRYGFTGKGYFSWELLGYDSACMFAFLLVGIVIFNIVEKDAIDTI
jgi:lipopolysaccharide transport system permease protein